MNPSRHFAQRATLVRLLRDRATGVRIESPDRSAGPALVCGLSLLLLGAALALTVVS